VILVIALASILYGSVMAFTQTNVRLIAGYSSVAQLGFITAGIFALRADGPTARSCRWSTTAWSSRRSS
jgi:NADH:ubiquinone oxidoreductase subunit 4 (chain M)